MKHINSLIIQMRKVVKRPIYSAQCFIDPDETTGKWVAKPVFWDGVPLSGNMEGIIPDGWVSVYDTKEEAAEAVERLFNTLDIKHQPVILVDDLLED